MSVNSAHTACCEYDFIAQQLLPEIVQLDELVLANTKRFVRRIRDKNKRRIKKDDRRQLQQRPLLTPQQQNFEHVTEVKICVLARYMCAAKVNRLKTLKHLHRI